MHAVAITFGLAGLISIAIGIVLKPLPGWFKILALTILAAVAIGIIAGAAIGNNRR